MVAEILQHGGDAAGDAALHVDRTAAMEKAVLHLAGEGAVAPRALVARGHHVGMSGKGEMRRGAAESRIEVVDIRSASFRERDAVRLKTLGLEQVFQHVKRAGVGRRYGRAADEGLGNREGIVHVPGLTCMPRGGLALCGWSWIAPPARKNFARLMRPSKPNRNQTQSMGFSGSQQVRESGD